MRKIVLGLLVSFFMFSCDDTVEVNAPFVETPIIYSLLNTDDSLQVFRIQRAFSGEGGNAIELAKDPDKVYYDTAEIELNLRLVDPSNSNTEVFNEKLQVFLCDSCKEEGVFYSEEVPVYVTMNPLPIDPRDEDPLDAFLSFKNKETGHLAEAQTGLVPCFRIISPQWRCRTDIGSNPRMTFDDIEVRFVGPENGKLAYVSMSILYFEVPLNGGNPIERDTEDDQMVLVNFVQLDKSPGFQYEFRRDSLSFGNYMNGAIDTSNNAAIKERIIEDAGLATVYFNVFNNDYNDYQLINNNFNPITQTSPIYTNVKNGIGLMGARTLRVVPSVIVDISENGYWDRWPSIKHR